jgi:hypothetical protein
MKPLGLALLLVPIAAAAMADAPRVDVRFVVEAKQFVDGLGNSRKSVERAMTQLLLTECSDPKSFPFLQWVNGDATVPNRLVVALVEKKNGGDFETRIEYRATINGGGLPPDLGESVYRWFEAKNLDNADILKARLQKKIHAQFASESFRQNLLRYFVSRIALAENVGLAGQRVIVAVPALKAKEDESELGVSFFRRSDGQPGTMTLGEPLDYPERGGVICTIRHLNSADLQTDGWHPRVPEVLGPSKIRDVRVMMKKYVPKWFPDSHLGAVTSE